MWGQLRSFFRGSASVERIIDCKQRRSRLLRVESLEERRMLAAMLFVDFGDNFAGGILSTTQGGLRDVAGGANPILGVTLEDADDDFNAGTQVDIIAQTFNAGVRAQMMDVVRRAYLPLDITVVELTSSVHTTADGRQVAGAVTMDDVINTLRSGDPNSRDAYVFVATFIVDPGGDDEISSTDYDFGGTSPGHANADLQTASNAHDDLAVVFSSGGGFNRNTANNISHEAGHLFGLRHSITNPAIEAETNLVHQAEIMSYRNTNVTTSSMFTRYPMIRGDGNSPGFRIDATVDAAARTITRAEGDFTTAGLSVGQEIRIGSTSNSGVFTIQSIAATVLTLTADGTLTNATESMQISWGPGDYDELAARNDQVTIYDQMRFDANILANPDYSFISGTGAHDIITIVRDGANAVVTIEAFADAAFTIPITVPDLGGTSYSYSFPLTNTILVYAGDSDDRIIVDVDLGVDVQIDGMLGTDSLIANGKNVANVIYTPNATAPPGVDLLGPNLVASFGGTLTFGDSSIVFYNFETNGSLTIRDVDTVTYVTPAAGADALTVNRSSSAPNNPQVTGTVNDGTAVVPLLFQSVDRLAIQTGVANDTLTVSTSNGLVNFLRGIDFDGGDGFDRINVTGSGSFNNETIALGASSSEGRHTLDGQAINFQNIEPITTNVPAANFAISSVPGIASLLDADNAINYTSGVINGPTWGRVTVDNFEPIEFTNKTSLTIDAGAGSDTINLNNPNTPTGLTSITINGNDPTASDTVIVNGTLAADNIVLTGLSNNGAVITGAQPVPVTIATAEHLTIHGQGGGDSFTYTTPAGRDDVVYTPGSSLDVGTITGTDLTAPGLFASFLPVTFANLGTTGSITIADAGGSRVDSLQLSGTNSDETFSVSATGVLRIQTSLISRTLDINTPGIAAVTLLGLDGNDVFNVAANHPFAGISSPGILVEGGNPSASDVLNFNGTGAAITADLQATTIAATGSGAVAFSGIEHVNIDAENANLTVLGTDLDDLFTYTPTGAEAGTFALDGLNTTFNFQDLDVATSRVFTVDLRADTADEVVVLGTNNHDVITVDAPNRRIDVENVAGLVLAPIVLASTVEIATVRARLGNDTILVVPAPGTDGNLSILVDGGAPSASDALVLAGALTRTNANSPVTDVAQFNAATDFVVQYESLLPGEGRIRVFRNAVAMPDISYVGVEVVSPIVDPNPDPNTGDPRLLILGPDQYEANESRATAAFLGSGSVLNVSNLAIFPNAAEHRFVPADQDYFRVVAQKTGTLDFQVYFRMFPANLLPAGGNINIEVLDSDGTVIAGTLATGFGTPDGDPDARVRIPVVAGQSYYLHVFGGNADGTPNGTVVNGYDLSIFNDGPPTPYDLELRDVIDASAIDASTSTTQFSGGAGLVAVNDFYNGKDIAFLSGPNIGRRVRVIDYVGATGDFVVQGGVLVAAPAVGDLFQIESHDTGSSQLDNYTRDNTPLIFFRLDDAIFLQDLPGNAIPDSPPDEVIPIPFVTSQLAVPPAGSAGYRVAIFDNGDSNPENPDILPQVPVGYARKVADGIYVFDFDTDALSAPFVLSDGSHFLSARVQMIDPATPSQTGWGPRSVSLEIVVDSAAPPLFFGDAAVADDGLHPDSDSRVPGDVQPQNDFDDNQNINSRSDRVTNDTTPTFWGTAEADSTIRLYLDMNNNAILELDTDLLLGLQVAVPDGTNQFPFGQWTLTSNIDMNRADIVAALGRYDGLRTIFATAEDVAGNITNPLDAAQLNIFIDTQGPQITGVEIDGFPDYDLFDPKPSENGFTPLVYALKIDVRDLPNRSNVDSNFLYQALVENIAEAPGNFLLVGDHVGAIAIQSIVWVPDPFPALNGEPGMGSLTITFFSPLPDDRYTLTIRDNLVDPANNRLDGESNAAQPLEDPNFPSGDGVPGGDFVARFTVDSRPEIGSSIPQGIQIDINGNFVWDPANAQTGNDATNVDLAFELAAFENGALIPGGLSVHDLVVVGRFTAPNAANLPERLFDQLASYGNYNGVFRWLIDFDSDGVVYGNGDPDGVNDLIVNQGTLPGFNSTARAGAIPVAGNFDRNNANGDEIGLYYDGIWALDTNHDYILDKVITGSLKGAPIVGDFDGDGNDDLAVFNNNEFFFDLTFNALLHTSASSNAKIIWGFPGVLDRPVAADMDQDGIDDIGLWVPRNGPQPPQIIAEWYFLLSGDFDPTPNNGVDDRVRITGQVNTLNHPFSPVPFGFDLFAEFGDEQALPIVGNFDPPVAQSVIPSESLVGDYNGDRTVNQQDYPVWRSTFGATTNLNADGNSDGRINAADYVVWRDRLGQSAAGTGSSAGAGEAAASFATSEESDHETTDFSTFAVDQLPNVYVSSSSDSSSNRNPRTPEAYQSSAKSSQLLLLDALWSDPDADELPSSADLWEDDLFEESDYNITSLDSAFAAILDDVAA